MEEKRIDRLYEILERLEHDGKADDTAALRWAIFRLESM